MDRDRWEILSKVAVQGGQGLASQGQDRETGELVFIKELVRSRRRRTNRGRFRREATAYATVQDAGLPRLIYDNSADWEDASADLFIVLEWIEGSTLTSRVERGGAVGLAQAARCVEVLGTVLGTCHARGVTHRDIKPANVMLRGGDIGRPVLVDFGLSFNDDFPDDLTKIQEVGNRFLRLPEHAAEGNSRSHVSDISQLSGILLYLLSGREPRVLSDEHGRAPHRRDRVKEPIAEVVSGRQLRRLNQLFDQSFAVAISERHQSVDDFLDRLRWVLAAELDASTLDLDGEFAELVSDPSQRAGADLHAVLSEYTSTVMRIVSDLAVMHSLGQSQTGHEVDVAATPPFAQTKMKLYPQSLGSAGSALPWITYRFEPRGGDEFVAIVRQEMSSALEAEEVWRGTSPRDLLLEDAVARTAKASLLEFLRDRD